MARKMRLWKTPTALYTGRGIYEVLRGLEVLFYLQPMEVGTRCNTICPRLFQRHTKFTIKAAERGV